MTYDIDPNQILLQNRTQDPSVFQINDLAKLAVNFVAYEKRIAALEAAAAKVTRPFSAQPTRDLDTDFIVSATRAAYVSYTIETSTSATGAGANDTEAVVQLVVDGAVLQSAKNRIAATLTAILGLLGISLTSSVQRWQLAGYVQAGAIVNITTSGTGTKTFISAQEILQ